MSNSLDKLENYNINPKDIQKIKDIGIKSIQQLYMTSRKNLLNIKGFTDKKVKNIFEAANKIEVYGLFQRGSAVMNERNNIIFKISTNSINLDNILNGGIESSSLTEILGEKNTCKTDFIHILTVTSQKVNKNNKIIYIDFDNTFNKKRIIEFAKSLNLNKKKVLDNIDLINNIGNYEQFMQKLNEISDKMQKGEYSLIIIESLISIFQNFYKEKISFNTPVNVLELKLDIESKLGKVLLKLKNIALLFNIVVVITRRINNDKNNEENVNNFDLVEYDPNIDIILGNECNTRIKLKKIKNGNIKCFLLNSPMLPENNCQFIINEKGIIDCNFLI